jgi:hypothetical protein
MTAMLPQAVAPPAAWNLRMGQGSSAQYAFAITTLAGSPYPFDDTTWEYVVRPDCGPGAAVLTITTTPSAGGSLTVTGTDAESVVTLALTPAATSGVVPGGYAHALWMNPSTDDAYLWFTGALDIDLVPQP